MPGGYGSAKNGVRLGVFWDSIDLNSDGSKARIIGGEIRIDRDVNIADSTNKLSWSGGAVVDGSDSNINVSGSGAKKIKSVTGQWQDLVYGSTKSENFAASMSGVDYAGGTISESRSVTYPARKYLAPVSPTDLAWTQTSVGNFTLTWTNQATAAAPWTTVVLVRTEVGGTTTEIPVSSAASSITQNGMALDKRYTWYLRITNPQSTVVSATTDMTPIPLHSMTLSASSVAIGGSVTFTINKYGSSNLSTIYFIKNGVKTIVWDKQAGTSFTYTFTQADWAAFLPNETSKVFVVGLETFSGTTSLGAQTQNLTVTVPAAAPYLPTATAPTRSEQVTVVSTAFGTNVFVKNKSRIRYTWSGSAGASATITKREILITRSWQSGQSVIDVTSASGYMYEEVPTGNGTVTVASRTTDSRGRIATSGNATFTVYNYADPVITTFTVTRCDSAGNTNNSGTYVKFTINVAATSVNPGSEANQMQFRIRLLNSSGSETGSDLYAKALNNTLTTALTTGALGAGAYSTQAGYSFRLTLNDDLTNATGVPIIRSASISSEVYPLTIGTNGIAIGKVYNDPSKALDVVGMGLITGSLDVTGEIKKAGRPVLQDISNILDITQRIPSGLYQGNLGTTALGWPTTNDWQHLLAVTHNNESNYYSMQFAAPFSGSNDLYFRNTNNVGTKAWSKLAKANTLEDVPSLPASQVTSGIFDIARIPSLDAGKITSGTFAVGRLPLATTEAIGAVERATDAEARTATDTTRYVTPAGMAYAIQTQGVITDTQGVCTRFPDGTQICYNRRNVTPVADNVTSFTWTFPLAFSAEPAAVVTANTTATTVRNTSMDGSPGLTSCKPGVYRTNNTSTELLTMAIGRWK